MLGGHSEALSLTEARALEKAVGWAWPQTQPAAAQAPGKPEGGGFLAQWSLVTSPPPGKVSALGCQHRKPESSSGVITSVGQGAVPSRGPKAPAGEATRRGRASPGRHWPAAPLQGGPYSPLQTSFAGRHRGEGLIWTLFPAAPSGPLGAPHPVLWHLPLPGVWSPAARRACRWAPQPMLTVVGQVRPGKQPAPALTRLGDTTASDCMSSAWLGGSVGGTPEAACPSQAESPTHTVRWPYCGLSQAHLTAWSPRCPLRCLRSAPPQTHEGNCSCSLQGRSAHRWAVTPGAHSRPHSGLATEGQPQPGQCPLSPRRCHVSPVKCDGWRSCCVYLCRHRPLWPRELLT